MGLFDVILLIIISGFAMFGFWFGLIHTLGSLLGTILGAFLASRWYEPMGEWLANITGWEGNVPKVVMFIIAFVVINRLVGFGFWIFEKTTDIVTKLPFIKGINRFLGMMLGIFEGILTLGLILYFIDKVPLSEHFMGYIDGSFMAPFLTSTAAILIPLLPDALKLLESGVDYVEDAIL
ncbi:MAG: CvpA family protein [Candidatus Magasanikbacteria bacterium]|jgi:uncharacterized membrane protein required for colicin V production|nr:CvpA family protein [Candidatus Magasanikbacteria bacterium]MBT4315303.1 CvpA family protein [Candidatus Magasanikbacteria bacterium]MBT4547175.1 CvpA family protein [Candidatus Magasanikbacteria bacterium]MBT6819685.1 CvpA family protein [Candidatus Magasanikbacteria bacterium]